MRVTSVVRGLILSVILVACGGGGGEPDTDSSADKGSPAYIAGLSSYVGDVRVEDTLVAGKQSEISVSDLDSTDIKVQVLTKRGEMILTPSEVSEVNQTIDFMVPANVVNGNLSIVKGVNTLSSVPYQVYKDYTPFIQSISPDTAKPGDLITVTGNNLSEPLKVFSEWGNIDMDVSLSDNQATFLLPVDARSGYLRLRTEQMDSNELYFMVKRDIDVKVVLEEGVEFDAKDIGFSLAMEEYTLDESYQATIPVGNSLQQLFATVEQSDGGFSMLYSAVVLPDMIDTVIFDSHSTAISLVFVAMGVADSNLDSSQWRSLYDELAANTLVLEFSQTIASLQKNNFSAWADRSDEDLKTKFQNALQDVLENYSAKQASISRAAPKDSDRSLVTIEQNPESGNIYIDDAISGKKLNNGSVSIVNKTRLYLSLVANSKKSGDPIKNYETHITNFMNAKQFMNSSQKGLSLIGPNAGGILNSDKVQKIKLEGEDANIQVLAAGYNGTTDEKATLSALKTLTMIEGVAIPTVDLYLSILTGKEIPKQNNRGAYRQFIRGMTVVFKANAEGIYNNGDFVTQLAAQLSDSNRSWSSIGDALFLTPLKKGLSSCTSVLSFSGSTCGKTLTGVSIMLGLDPANAARTIGYVIASAIQERIARRSVAAVPVVGWAIAIGFVTAEVVNKASKVATIINTVKDATLTQPEFNADVEFELKVTDVKPTCIAVAPGDIESALFVSGERFLLEDGSSPRLMIGGQEADNLDTVTETKVYGKFDSQSLISDGSQKQLVFLDYGDLSVEYDGFISIVDQSDEIAYFDEIVPSKAAKDAQVQLKGCGWIPLDDLKVFFSKEDSYEYVEAEILLRTADTIDVKVPANAKSGSVYVTAGNKVTKKLLFDVDPFSLNEPYEEDQLAKKDQFSWTGHALDQASNIYFIDHTDTKYEGIIISSDVNSIKAEVPESLEYGQVKIYVLNSDGIESNEISLPFVPIGVDANPASQSFEDSITVTLTQEDNVDIFFRIDDGTEHKYTAPIVLRAEDATYEYFSIYTFARVEVDGVQYESNELEYKYSPDEPNDDINLLVLPRHCPQLNPIDYFHSEILISGVDSEGYSYDKIACNYFSGGVNAPLQYETQFTREGVTPYIFENKNGAAWGWYENGAFKLITPYKAGKVHGIKKEYLFIGNLKVETPFIEGVITGVKKEYHEYNSIYLNGNDKVSVETTYLDGEKDGETRFYDTQGILTNCLIYEIGTYSSIGSCMP